MRHLLNVAVRIGVRTGIAPKRFHLLMVRGRKSGRLRSTPIVVLTRGEERWLVAPYGEREWVKNARAVGRVTLSRALHKETVLVEEVGALEAIGRSTRLNSSHTVISYAVFCLKKKKKKNQ